MLSYATMSGVVTPTLVRASESLDVNFPEIKFNQLNIYIAGASEGKERGKVPNSTPRNEYYCKYQVHLVYVYKLINGPNGTTSAGY